MIYLIAVLLVLAEIGYIKIAVAKNIKDTPNHRSAHSVPTVRGGGIIIFISVLLYVLFFPVEKEIIFFTLSISIVAIISFIDDLVILSSKVRLFTHSVAFLLIFYGLSLFSQLNISELIFMIFIYICSIGYLNIYNFMDGINGMTFLNAFISFGTLLYLNKYFLLFTDSNLLIVLLIAVIIFGFFNFRKKAICFAGDIGSIAIGFSLIYFVLKFYLLSKDPIILLIFALYLLDGGWTIIERLYRNENIFEAHRRHFYQLLSNELKISHLKVSSWYFLLQLLVNFLLIFSITYEFNSIYILTSTAVVLSLFYFLIKKSVIKKTNRI